MRRKAHASGPPPSGHGPSTPLPSVPTSKPDDWTTALLDRIDDVVDKIRSNTSDRLVRLARLVVVGLLVVIMAISAALLATIAVVRALNEAIPGEVWIVYFLLGAIFTAAGAFMWSQRTPRPAASTD